MWIEIKSILWWLCILLLVTCVVLLVAFYIKGAFRKRIKYRVINAPSPEEPRFPLTIASVTNSFITKGVAIDFWDKPALIQQARLAAIRKAQYTIDFETFFMTPGKRADDFAMEIVERAIAGVKVRLIVDHYGTKDMPSQYWQRLRAVGVEVVFFNSFEWRAPLDYAGRTHRKLLIIDGQLALMGAAGISDLWDGTEKDDDTQPWLDIEVCLEGEIVTILEGIFSQHWTYGGGTANLQARKFHTSPDNQHQMFVTVGANPDCRYSPIRSLKEHSIICARKRIWLASPYFLPNNNFCKLLVAAKKDGLDVRVLTTSKRSDKKPVYYASYEHYGKLLRGGVEIYEYQPSMTHAKMMLIDDRWIATGSANLDPRSFIHNEELDLFTSEPKLVNSIKKVFEKGFAKSKQISLTEWQHRSWWRHRLLGNLVDFFQWQL